MIGSMIVRAEIPGQDFIEAERSSSGWKIRAVGCSSFLTKVKILMSQEKNPELWDGQVKGNDHADLLLREFISKVKGTWDFPYKEEELCHCRSVSLKLVDEAVINGAHTPEAVSRKTSASTSCGTCRRDVINIIDYRTKKKSA